ncbi:hypothetical protein ScPMuIL_015451 [Solemya velum]
MRRFYIDTLPLGSSTFNQSKILSHSEGISYLRIKLLELVAVVEEEGGSYYSSVCGSSDMRSGQLNTLSLGLLDDATVSDCGIVVIEYSYEHMKRMKIPEVVVMPGKKLRHRMESVKNLFERLDTNGVGYLEKSDIAALVVDMSEENLDKLFEQLDTDGDGKISADEFTSGYRGLAANRKLPAFIDEVSDNNREVEVGNFVESLEDGLRSLTW